MQAADWVDRADRTENPADYGVPLAEASLEERAGFPRRREPVLAGLPLPQGLVADPALVGVRDAAGRDLPLQTQIAARWPDGSIQWLHCDFFASAGANEISRYVFYKKIHGGGTAADPSVPELMVKEDADGFWVDTGAVSLRLVKSGPFLPWDAVVSASAPRRPIQTEVTLKSAVHGLCRAEILSTRLEKSGPLHCAVLSEGVFRSPHGIFPLRFRARHHLYAGLGFCKLDFLVHNPRAAKHARALWDLGDERSVFFEDLSLVFGSGAGKGALRWKFRPGEAFRDAEDGWELFQGSSGGANWQSVNHVNRDGKIPLPFQGCRVRTQAGPEWTERATPLCRLDTGDASLGISLRDFWQNFPKALRSREDGFHVQLFPEQFGDAFEIQPGEQKSHTLFLQADRDAPGELDSAHTPLIPSFSPQWYAETKVHPYFTAPGTNDDPAYFSLMREAAEGPRSFFAKREIIDEYGWRNFGEAYADHESAFNELGKPNVSHYNNQYDLIYGAILHYWRSGAEGWRRFADELARHVRDIDIYHTREDRYEFNGGLFWHSNHYLAAETASHRCFSRKHWVPGYGGGPSPAHCYATGLIHHYYLTGEQDSLESARELTDYARRLLLGAPSAGERLRAALRRSAKRVLALARRQILKDDLAGPTRAAANVLSVLLDGYQLSRRDEDLEPCDTLIRRCVSDADAIDAMNLLDAENNWSYLMFLQTVGRFLDVLTEKGETAGARRTYAVKALSHYARWMASNERPFLSKAEGLKYPTETWATIELRKTNVFLYARKHGGEEQAALFGEKADFFYRRCFEDLKRFPEQAFFARPLAILMTNGLMKFGCQAEETGTGANPGS